MKYKLETRTKDSNGEILRLTINGKKCAIKFSYHAILRITKWGLKAKKVLDALLFPDEVIIGHSKRYIAHKVYGQHIVRAIYEYKNNIPFLITVYYPHKKRYFQGGGKFADKIFPGC